MSRDISSYFLPLNSKKVPESKPSRKRPKIPSDEDEPIQKSPIKRTKRNEKRHKPQVLSDSDDDSCAKKSPHKQPETKMSKVVSTKDIFGKTPIKRVSAPKIERKTPTGKKKIASKKEAECHNDEDFEKALEQLDTSTIEQDYLNSSVEAPDIKKAKNSDNKNTEPSPKKTRTHEPKSEKKDKLELTEDSPKKQKKMNLSKLKTNNEPSKDNVKSAKTSKKKVESLSKIEIEKHNPKKDKEEVKKDDPYKEIIEKKKQNLANYQQYLQRGGARNPGSKEIPQGADNCLAGLRFLITGVLDSLERDEADQLIQQYGGCTVHSVSKKLNYIIVGDEAGPSKIAKASALNIQQISEDDLLEMIRTRPAGKASSIIQPHHKKKEEKVQDVKVSVVKRESPRKKDTETIVKKEKETIKTEPSTSPQKVKSPIKSVDNKPVISIKEEKSEKTVVDDKKPNQVSTEALVEKYRPKSMKQIIGQQGDRSNANKLYKWLNDWHKNRTITHTKPAPWKSDDGAFFKAVLLSGPPGVGKTTTAEVVCKELGFDFIEFNASDTRSKKLLHEEVAGLLSNKTMLGYFTDANKGKPTKKHVLVMDEVDGMAGNEDRGGLQELIALIKTASVPIICICNDRNHPKMRTLSNYTFDLRFSKPKLEQIRSAMMSLCFKEGIKISKEDLDQLITSTDQDVRQIINHLALYGAGTVTEKKDSSEKKKQNKDLRLGNWDVARKVFSAEEHKHMSIHDKSDLFFHDYNIAPLFVQENYLSVIPNASREEILERMAEAAESIAIGDTIENSIRKNNAWSLLPTQAMFSLVIPGTVLSGRIAAQINFPNWLGRNSKRSKFDRLLQEITVHSRMTTGASKEAINLDYLKPLRDMIIRPLVTKEAEGVNEAVNAMNAYHLIREDLDSLIELSLWPGDRDPMQSVNSKVKAAFTRAYNKNSMAYAYSAGGISKKKGAAVFNEEGYEDEDEEDASEAEDDDVNNDKMIKAKKPTAKTTASTSKADSGKAASGRGKGRGRGRGK